METRLVWLDLEMTGLDPDSCRILEVAAILTDESLKRLDAFQMVAYCPPGPLRRMNDWCQATHHKSGLVKECQESEETVNQVEFEFIAWLKDNGFEHMTAVLAGNTIHFDRRFIARWMPDLHDFLHYRMIDITSVRETIIRVLPDSSEVRARAIERCNPDRDTDTHRALDDAQESIAEAQDYWTALKELSEIREG
jgi:oligoribonuclease